MKCCQVQFLHRREGCVGWRTPISFSKCLSWSFGQFKYGMGFLSCLKLESKNWVFTFMHLSAIVLRCLGIWQNLSKTSFLETKVSPIVTDCLKLENYIPWWLYDGAHHRWTYWIRSFMRVIYTLLKSGQADTGNSFSHEYLCSSLGRNSSCYILYMLTCT